MKLFATILISTTALACANVLELQGTFTNGQDFSWTLEYDPGAIDSNPLDSEGDYYSWQGQITLTFGDNRIETSGSSVYVYRNHNGLSGIAAYDEHGFTWNGYEFGPKGMYFGAFSPFVHEFFTSDSLSLVAELAGNPVWQSPAVTPYFELNDLSGALHLETDVPVPTFTVQVPEADSVLLLLISLVCFLGFYRDRKTL